MKWELSLLKTVFYGGASYGSVLILIDGEFIFPLPVLVARAVAGTYLLIGLPYLLIDWYRRRSKEEWK